MSYDFGWVVDDAERQREARIRLKAIGRGDITRRWGRSDLSVNIVQDLFGSTYFASEVPLRVGESFILANLGNIDTDVNLQQLRATVLRAVTKKEMIAAANKPDTYVKRRYCYEVQAD